jgi:hypothetical protein
MGPDAETLRALVRRLHVHYDVQTELDLREGARVPVALIVRLWAVHARGARALPGCPRCRELRSDLERIAAFALSGPAESRVTMDPLRPALYDSPIVHGADEICLVIRVAHGDGGAPIDGREQRSVKGIRAQLVLLGIPER